MVWTKERVEAELRAIQEEQERLNNEQQRFMDEAMIRLCAANICSVDESVGRSRGLWEAREAERKARVMVNADASVSDPQRGIVEILHDLLRIVEAIAHKDTAKGDV